MDPRCNSLCPSRWTQPKSWIYSNVNGNHAITMGAHHNSRKKQEIFFLSSLDLNNSPLDPKASDLPMSYDDTLFDCKFSFHHNNNPAQGSISKNGLRPMPNCLHSTPNFWEAVCGIKDQCWVQRINVGLKTVYVIEP